MSPSRRGGPWVLDASVVAAALFQEDHADACCSLLTSGRELHAPDLVYAEVGNVIWKRRRRGEIDEDEAAELLADALRLPLRITPSDALIDAALQVALKTDRTVYDCLYIALALRERAVMVTGDRRLASAMAGGPLAKHVAWIGAGG